MYTNPLLSEKYRTIDQRVGISVDSSARRVTVNAISNCPADIAAFYERQKSLQGLEIPGLNLNQSNLNPRDVLEILIAKGEQEAEQYASQALERIRDYKFARGERGGSLPQGRAPIVREPFSREPITQARKRYIEERRKTKTKK